MEFIFKYAMQCILEALVCLFLFCMFSCLYPFVCVFILFYLNFFFKTYVFKMFAFFVLKYHVSYNKRVLNERKSEQVHKPYTSIFLDNAIHIAW